MARKKATSGTTRRAIQQRDRSGEFIGKAVFATLASVVVTLLATLGLAEAAQDERWKTLFQIYQFLPPVIGIAAALLSGWVKRVAKGKGSETYFASLTAVLISALVAAVVSLIVR